jgi:hypothetical protein
MFTRVLVSQLVERLNEPRKFMQIVVVALTDNLRGNEFDMKGLVEFQSLLRGGN